MRDDRTGRGTASGALRVDRPTRGAERNRSAVGDQSTRVDDLSLLPTLDPGVTLLDVEGDRGVPIVQSTVLDHLLVSDGPAFWVDAQGYATTTSLLSIAPSRRLLDRIHVARGFTPYQHYGVLCALPDAVERHVRASTAVDPIDAHRGRSRERTEHESDGSPHTPSLIVAPAVDARYRDDDTLGETDADVLLARALARLSTYAEGYDVPVLVTRTVDDEFTDPVETVADRHLECEQTRMGPRFAGEEFETLVYPVDDGAYYQTTIAYWRELLGARADQVGLRTTRASDADGSSDGVGTGVTMDSTVASMTADPLHDAWTATASGGR